jgi:hypothetical protein
MLWILFDFTASALLGAGSMIANPSGNGFIGDASIKVKDFGGTEWAEILATVDDPPGGGTAAEGVCTAGCTQTAPCIGIRGYQVTYTSNLVMQKTTTTWSNPYFNTTNPWNCGTTPEQYPFYGVIPPSTTPSSNTFVLLISCASCL